MIWGVPRDTYADRIEAGRALLRSLAQDMQVHLRIRGAQ